MRVRDQLGDLRGVGGAEEVLALGLVLPDLDELIEQVVGAFQGDPGRRFDLRTAAVGPQVRLFAPRTPAAPCSPEPVSKGPLKERR
ncbi:hypothetical protein GCM10010510_09900 [Streptomyces anandii JCM 4720]|nr:hypothetical protein [Streptomyces anandii]GGX67550.1 hypothetical protein GCM10010510_09900 [Streptomyces anandii JCM 4720]